MTHIYFSTRAGAVFLLLLLIGVADATAQNRLSVYSLNTGAFPTVRAKMLVGDNAGNLVTTLRPEDIRVTENGIPRPVTRLSCNTVQMPKLLSVAVSFDLSSSMQLLEIGPEMPHRLGQHSMRYLARNFMFPHSEMALQGFDAYLPGGIPLTRNSREFLDEVDRLPSFFNNDFFIGLGEQDRGSLNVVKKGTHRRVVILVSDSDAFLGPYNENLIQNFVDSCAKYSIRFYAVIFRLPSPKLFTFQPLIDATGGRVYDLIRNRAQAEAAIRDILAIEQGGNGCDLEWQSLPGCPVERKVVVSIPSLGLSTETDYIAPIGAAPSLRVEPRGLAFGPIAPGSGGTLDLTITAEDQPVTIRSIDGIAPPFTLQGVSTPFTLQPGDSRTLTVSFSPTDSVLFFGQIRFNRDQCDPVRVDLSGGIRRRPTVLTVVAPDGAEKLFVGDIATLQWGGVAAGEPMKLEYSIDKGRQWRTIVDGATGLQHQWLVPNSVSDSCLFRVSYTGASARSRDFLDAGGYHNWCAFSPDNSLIATANFDRTASLKNAATAAEVHRLTGHSAEVNRIEFSRDGANVVTASVDNTARVWEAATGRLVRILAWHAGPVNAASFSPDGGRVVTAGDYRAIVWSVETGEMLAELTESSAVREARFNHDGSRIVLASNDIVVRDAFSGAELKRFVLSTPAHQAEFSDDGALLLLVEGKTIRVYETASWSLLSSFETSDRFATPMAHFRAFDRTIVTASAAAIEFRDPFSGRLLGDLPTNGTGGLNAAFSGDRRRLVSVTQRSGTVWDLDGSGVGADISDTLWSIVYPEGLNAGFSINLDTICAGDCIEPVSSSIGNVSRWEWTFDGATPTSATGVDPGRVCYTQPGRFFVRLIISNERDRDTLLRWITVESAPAVPVISQCGSTLTTSPADSFQWYRDDLPIDGATSRQIEIDRSGVYAVRVFNSNGCSALSVPYPAEVDTSPTATISIADIQGTPGELIQVPVSIRFPNAGTAAPYRLKLQLDYNRSILIPVGRQQSRLDGSRGVIDIEIIGASTVDTVVNVAFRVALGDAPSTTLGIDSARLESACPLELIADAGLLSLAGLCENGGTRLIATADSSALKVIRPNPAVGSVTIEYSLVESGRVDIALYDLLGNHVATVVSGVLTVGGYAATFDVSGLPSGRYHCVYTTPTGRFSETLFVE